LSDAHPKGNEKPTEDQPKAWTENSGPFQSPQSHGTAIKEAIADIGDEEKDEQTNDDKDEMENEEDSFPFPEKPGKGGQDPRQEKEQHEEREADYYC
jgi:hypothetical protein